MEESKELVPASATETDRVTNGTLEYTSNNSGGSWWLKDEDWKALEEAGWKVDWIKDQPPGSLFGRASEDGRWLGALAKEASKRFENQEAGVLEWSNITGQSPFDQGCNCCGRPHDFVWRADDGTSKYMDVEYGPISASWD
jgi:hypothetical protein